MTCILYGIVALPRRDREDGGAPLEISEMPTGVGDAPIRLIAHDDLAAVVSTIDSQDATPSLARAMAYARVVEALHARAAILPMRYGCLFGEDSQVVGLLRARGAQFTEVLRGLDGCEEMGVRILLDGGAGRGARPRTWRSAEGSSAPGTAYLGRRWAASVACEGHTREALRAVERIRGAVAGLYVRVRTELPDAGLGRPGSRFALPAIHFLVRRLAIEPFRQAFRSIAGTDPARLLLSGPWPPYNFAESQGEEENGQS